MKTINYKNYKSKTLAECIKEELYTEYANGSESDDLFVEIEIINPENEQCTKYAWVPMVMAGMLEAEREIALTEECHKFSSKLIREMHEFYKSEVEMKSHISEIIKEIEDTYGVSIGWDVSFESIWDSEEEKFRYFPMWDTAPSVA